MTHEQFERLLDELSELRLGLARLTTVILSQAPDSARELPGGKDHARLHQEFAESAMWREVPKVELRCPVVGCRRQGKHSHEETPVYSKRKD